MKKRLLTLSFARTLFLILFLIRLNELAVHPQANAPVEIRIPIAPTAVKATTGKVVLAYELHITNFQARDIVLNRIDALGPDAAARPIATYQDADLLRAITRPGASTPIPDKRVIGGGMRAIVYIWLSFDKPEVVPGSLRHRFSFMVAGADGTSEPRDMDAARIELPQVAPVVISSPFKGGIWLAGNGPSSSSGHRHALIPVAGEARISQRFAIDWLKFAEDGKAWRDDPKTNAAWYGYGVEVLAVADGVITAVKDGIPENVPLSTPAVPITVETIGGNHVILDLGKGRFALYAHLQPGSLRVKIGDRVRRGQVLGLVGNSGNSDAPHLHFHISNGNSPLGSEGVPFVFESFDVVGTADLDEAIERGWTVPPVTKPDTRVREMPVENLVVRFH